MYLMDVSADMQTEARYPHVGLIYDLTVLLQ